MKNNSKNRFFALLATLAAAAVLLSLALRDTPTTEAAMRKHSALSTAQAGRSVREIDAAAHGTSAPYRDGLFQGKLARERGDALHISDGRWPLQADRDAYVEGYTEGFAGTANSEQAAE